MTPTEKAIWEAGNDLDLTISHMRIVQRLIYKAADLRVGDPVERHVLDEIVTTIDCLEKYIDQAEEEHKRLWEAAGEAIEELRRTSPSKKAAALPDGECLH